MKELIKNRVSFHAFILQGDHPLIDYILEHRTLSKLKSTYVDALPKLAEPKTARVHTDKHAVLHKRIRLCFLRFV